MQSCHPRTALRRLPEGGPDIAGDVYVKCEDETDIKSFKGRGALWLLAGLEYRRSYGPVFVSNTSQFYFNTATTADTFSNPNTALVGDQWATFLLGSLDNQTEMVGGPVPNPINNFWGLFI